ncbi:MAG: hypothetical protein A2795_14265 [Caulobacterales bacterium RIFCSPHIGHO2_01_FULL_67_30]|nr:MAG: hypothetical protein A2795_14265 [Caulobacterales bacterium RIFCSPHIGHO2_01_FULL_67_30]
MRPSASSGADDVNQAGGGQDGATVHRKAKPNSSEPKKVALAVSRRADPHQLGERLTWVALGSVRPRPIDRGGRSVVRPSDQAQRHVRIVTPTTASGTVQ